MDLDVSGEKECGLQIKVPQQAGGDMGASEGVGEEVLPLVDHSAADVPPGAGEDQRVPAGDGEVQGQGAGDRGDHQAGELSRLQVPAVLPVHAHPVLQHRHPLIPLIIIDGRP